jgi:hypothetical protein
MWTPLLTSEKLNTRINFSEPDSIDDAGRFSSRELRLTRLAVLSLKLS